jgi:hypothetical protein
MRGRITRWQARRGHIPRQNLADPTQIKKAGQQVDTLRPNLG